jgi:hypothetical protein
VWWRRYHAAAADMAAWRKGSSDGRTHVNAFYDGPK